MSFLVPRSPLQRPRPGVLLNAIEIGIVLVVVTTGWLARRSDPRHVIEATRRYNGLTCVHTPTGTLRVEEHQSLTERDCSTPAKLDTQAQDLCRYLEWSRQKIDQECRFYKPSLLDVLPPSRHTSRARLVAEWLVGSAAGALALSLLLGWIGLRGEMFSPRIRGLMACAVLATLLAIVVQMTRARSPLDEQTRLVNEWSRQCGDALQAATAKREQMDHALAARKDELDKPGGAKKTRELARLLQMEDLKKMLTDLRTEWACPAPVGPLTDASAARLVGNRPVIVGDEGDTPERESRPQPRKPLPPPMQNDGGTTATNGPPHGGGTPGGPPPPSNNGNPPPGGNQNAFELCKASPAALLLSEEVGVAIAVLCQLPGLLNWLGLGNRTDGASKGDGGIINALRRIHENRASEEDLQKVIAEIPSRNSGDADEFLRELTARYGSSGAVGDWFTSRCGRTIDCNLGRVQAYKALGQVASVCRQEGNPDQLLDYLWQKKCAQK